MEIPPLLSSLSTMGHWHGYFSSQKRGEKGTTGGPTNPPPFDQVANTLQYAPQRPGFGHPSSSESLRWPLVERLEALLGLTISGILTVNTRLVNGGPSFYFGVEEATCFKWLQNVSPKEPCILSGETAPSKRDK